MASNLELIRNFAIIAHIDHGKSTLADRIIEFCGGLQQREMTEQVLDTMDIEKERGITIKAQTVRLNYKAKDGNTYQLNLMDTPGHVDFSYEVSRSLASCEGSVLVVDATQGVEAQTLANVYLALDNNHEIIPVLNKIDLPSADPQKVKQQIEDVIGLDASEAVETSGKTGLGVENLLEEIVKKLPSPEGNENAPLKALLIDSWYDSYLGVVILVRIKDGILKKKTQIRMMSNGATYQVECRIMNQEGKNSLVGVCFLGEYDIAAALVNEGLAFVTKEAAVYEPYEQNAKAERRGLWRGTFYKPWDWRNIQSRKPKIKVIKPKKKKGFLDI